MKGKKKLNKVNISNNNLAAILTVAIIFSILFTWNTLNNFESPTTGRASSLIGTANVTITREVAISFAVANISFVDSTTGTSRDSTKATDVNSCGVNGACGLNITNDGSVPVNISLETTRNMFSGTSPVFTCNLSKAAPSEIYWIANAGGFVSAGNAAMQNCLVAAGTITSFIANLSFTDPQDWAMIDVAITVPVDEASGVKVASIVLTASDACPGDNCA